MKKNIILLFFLLLLFCSCSWEQEQDLGDSLLYQLTYGLMQVEITENSGQGTDKIKTVRFIVFTNPVLMPKVEKNEYYDEKDFVIEQPLDQPAASKVKAILKVSRKENDPNDKLIVAIVNEPPAMTGTLNTIMIPGELASLELDMAYFVTDDHLSLKTDVMMPMSGAVWIGSDDIYLTREDAEQHKVTLSLQRAVSRVDVYMDTNIVGGLQIVAGSHIMLNNTYTKSYLARHEDQNGHVFGNIQSVRPGDFIQKSWILSEQLYIPHNILSNLDLPSSTYICTFYTPERYCELKKLILDVGVKIQGEEGFKSGEIILDAANDKNGVVHPIDIIRRNRIYKVIVNIGVNGITAVVRNWNDEEIFTEL